jgi:hypothetical protein
MQAAEAIPADPGFWHKVAEWIDTPAPYSPFSEYLLLMFVLWLVARLSRKRDETFSIQAQEVLDEKYEKGELSKKAYDKFRADVSMRPKR